RRHARSPHRRRGLPRPLGERRHPGTTRRPHRHALTKSSAARPDGAGPSLSEGGVGEGAILKAPLRSKGGVGARAILFAQRATSRDYVARGCAIWSMRETTSGVKRVTTSTASRFVRSWPTFDAPVITVETFG